MISEIDRMGAALEAASLENFSSAARDILTPIPFHKMFSDAVLPELRARHAQNEIKLEHECRFSDECLVVYVGAYFTIEIYHWLYSDTGIHDHNFKGAFQCLLGENHQVEFLFLPEKEIFEGLESGNLELVKDVTLRPGDTQEIKNDDHFIHAVAHSPSTWNLCIRTKGDKNQILKAYHTHGFRYALSKEREERLLDLELSDLKLENLDSTDLLHVYHMLGTKPGHHDIRLKVDQHLKDRHGISYLSMTEETSRYLNQLSKIAKDY